MDRNCFFSLLRCSLFPGQENTFFTGIEWSEIFEEMKAQAVAALPMKWLLSYPLPDKVLNENWLFLCFRQQAFWTKMMVEQSRMLDLLDKQNIPCVIIKGTAAGMAYPNPYLRASGDVDFLVKRCDYERAAGILEENGFVLAHKKDPCKHHYAYSKNGIFFELHRRLAIITESDEKLLSVFEKGIANREIYSIGDFHFPVLPPELNGLTLIFHINQHLRKGLGLRQIIDWMMYVDSLSADTWENKLLPMLRETGMEKLALTVTAMCQKYLGLSRTLVQDSDIYPCDTLMDLIMERGNFGKKSERDEKVALVFFDIASPVRLIRHLQHSGMVRWEMARKHRILQPFAWIYEIGAIYSEFLKTRMTPRRFLKQRKRGLERRKLIRDLGLELDRDIMEH